MTPQRTRFGFCFFFLVFGLLLGPTGENQAQKKKAPTFAPNPEAPTLTAVTPSGVQRGQSVEITLTGTKLTEPVAVSTSFPAQVSIPTDQNNGKDAGKLRVKIDVPANAPVGCQSIRLATTRGVSNLRLFCIDDLPQVNEVDTNRDKKTPQTVPVPCVVLGRAEAESNDYYKIAVKAGQRLSFEIVGRRLGGPIDPQLTLLDAKTGRELPGGHNNDASGLQTDPRLTYVFKEAGECLVEVRDALYRGGADYAYRLRIGDFPCALTTLPMAVQRGSQTRLGFTGTMVEGTAPVEVFVPSEQTAESITLTPRGANGLHGWPVTVLVSDEAEVLEREPNNDAAKAMPLPIPCGLTGRFEQSGDVDYYALNLKKGQRIIIDAQTHELQSPTEVYMVLRDAKNLQVAASNPAQAPRVDYTAPADGTFTLMVEHLLYWGGPTETYHLTIKPYAPGFDLTLPLDRFDVTPGSVLQIPVLVTRRDYNGPITLAVTGPPGVTGRVVVPAGQPAAGFPAVIFAETSAELPAGILRLQVEGSATINGKLVATRADVRTLLSQGLNNLAFPPRPLQHDIALGVTEKAPFTLSLRLEPETIRGGAAAITVVAQRAAGFNDAITLTPAVLPENVTTTLKTIAAGQSEARGQVTAAAGAALGTNEVVITGKAKQGSREVSMTATPAALTVLAGFTVSVESATVTLKPGEKAKLKATVTRQRGHDGPIKVQVRNLPAGVTAAEATVAPGQATTEVELAAAADAKPLEKKDVQLAGSSDKPAKEEAISGNVAVTVAKPG